MAGETVNKDDIMKILVATDVHLGYGEKKPIIDQDSFKTFEEVLQIAVKNKVDFVLLGGDLFHESQPSPYCIYKCTELLRRYCFGDTPVSIEFLSDQSVNFKHLRNPVVNYEDPNLNISLPIFSIHGNHDNPTGPQQVSALDTFSTTGLINYFGRWSNFNEIVINPILLKKGRTRLAMYGLSHIPDQRLARMFKEKMVTMLRPEEYTWFNLLVLHQNRANRGTKNFIPTTVIPDFIDLVIWGHEHDCNIIPVNDETGNVYISQPGSTVATSLSEGEAEQKHVGLLEIYKNKFKMIPIPLKKVRPFIFKHFTLPSRNDSVYDYNKPKDQASNLVKNEIEKMIKEAAERHSDPDTPPPLPLIRLLVKYFTETQEFNPIRLGHDFENKVANPSDIIKLLPSKLGDARRKKGAHDFSFEEDDVDEVGNATSVEDVIERYFENKDKEKSMSILLPKVMTKALSRYIEMNDTDSIKYVYELQKKDTYNKLIAKDPELDLIDDCLEEIKEERIRDEESEVNKFMNESNRPPSNKCNDPLNMDMDSDDSMGGSPVPSGRSKAGRGRARSRQSQSETSPEKNETLGGRGRGRARGRSRGK